MRPVPLTHAPLPALVLLTLGSTQDPTGPARLLPAVASRLGGLTGLPLAPISDPSHAPVALARLTAQPGPWLAPLPLDPGLWLPGGTWAEALGAWRQPCLLAFAASQLATGLPAAATALLERWNVPLVGLIQWEGEWDGACRRADGLPWLGRLGAEVRAGRSEVPAEGRDAAPARPVGAAASGPEPLAAVAHPPGEAAAMDAAIEAAGSDGEGLDQQEQALALRVALQRRCARLLADLVEPPLA
jgi:hypothetical protein